MDFTANGGASAFRAEFCPKGSLMGISVLDLVNGSKAAALSLSVNAPQVKDVDLNLYNITIKRNWFGRDCTAAFQRLDFRSPLYLGGQYEGTVISVTPKLVVADKPSDLFGQGIDAVLGVANALSPLPAPFLNQKGKVIDRAAGQFSSTLQVSDQVQLSIGPDGKHEATWVLEPDTERGIPQINVRAYLERVPSYFTMPASGWSAESILSRSFPSGAQFSYSNFGDFVGSLGASYTNMVAASEVSAFNASCQILQGEIARHGFSPMDRSLLLWGAARARANLRQNPEIDHTSCLQSVYLELERFDATKNIDPRPIEPPKAKKIPATEGQMRATLEFDSRLATFFRTGDWSARRDASELMFRWPLTYIDRHQAGLLTGAELELQNSDQWQTRRGDLPPIFAQRVGCYLFQPGAEGRSSQMIGLVDLGTEAASRESILRLTFDDAESSASSARVRQFEIIDPSSADSGLNLIKARHGTSCGGSSWRPTTLSN